MHPEIAKKLDKVDELIASGMTKNKAIQEVGTAYETYNKYRKNKPVIVTYNAEPKEKKSYGSNSGSKRVTLVFDSPQEMLEFCSNFNNGRNK